MRTLERHDAKAFEETKYFEGCLPIEEMADRGEETCASGRSNRSDCAIRGAATTPYAVVQLRKENAEGTAYNIVGFQTRLTWAAQRITFGRLPGLENAEWLRLGVMHRNTFIESPRLLDERLRLRGSARIYFAGQITGAEGYVEAAACGMMTGISRRARMLGLPPTSFPRESALGAVVAHLQNRDTRISSPQTSPGGRFLRRAGSAENRQKERRRGGGAAGGRGDRAILG